MAAKTRLLEQTITRLEMGNERARAERSRDIEAKEAEIDELRTQYQRRVYIFYCFFAIFCENNYVFIMFYCENLKKK